MSHRRATYSLQESYCKKQPKFSLVDPFLKARALETTQRWVNEIVQYAVHPIRCHKETQNGKCSRMRPRTGLFDQRSREERSIDSCKSRIRNVSPTVRSYCRQTQTISSIWSVFHSIATILMAFRIIRIVRTLVQTEHRL